MLPLSLGSRGAAFSSSVFQINAEKGTKTFYVHGDILSQNSEPFKSIVDGNWEESVNREINLGEWDADTVGRMIEYLYTKDYTWQKNGKFKPVPVIVPEESPSVEHPTDTLRPPVFSTGQSVRPGAGRRWTALSGPVRSFSKVALRPTAKDRSPRRPPPSPVKHVSCQVNSRISQQSRLWASLLMSSQLSVPGG